jgi:hypothetical protein
MARQRRGQPATGQGALPVEDHRYPDATRRNSPPAAIAAEGRTPALEREPDTSRLSNAEVAQARRRRIAAMRLQEIEGNPLDAEQVAMFEMFEREAWTHERRLAHLLTRARTRAAE